LNFGAILHCVQKFNFISDMQLVIYVVPVIMFFMYVAQQRLMMTVFVTFSHFTFLQQCDVP